MEEELVVPQSTTTDSKEEEREDLVEDEEEDEFGFGISDVALSDDFFVDLDGFASPSAGDCFPDHFPPATFALPNWVANNAG
jgi:WRKY transcription factor 22